MLPVHTYDMAKLEAQAKMYEADRARRASGPSIHKRSRSLLQNLRNLLVRI